MQPSAIPEVEFMMKSSRSWGLTGIPPLSLPGAEVIWQGKDITFVAVGSMVVSALQAAAKLRRRA